MKILNIIVDLLVLSGAALAMVLVFFADNWIDYATLGFCLLVFLEVRRKGMV